MYLVVPQLKNRLAGFYLLADDRATSRSYHFNLKKKKKEKHKIRRRRPTIKIRLQELSLYITRIISKTYFQIYLVAAYREVPKNSPKSHAEVMCVM